jgi:hypothetical protein
MNQVLAFGTRALLEVVVDHLLVERVELMEVPLQPPPQAPERVHPPQPRHVVGHEESAQELLHLVEDGAGLDAPFAAATVTERDAAQDPVARRHEPLAQVHGGAGRGRARDGGDERGDLALADAAHARGAQELRQGRAARGAPEGAAGMREDDVLQAVGDPGGRGQRRAPRHGPVVGLERGAQRAGGGDDERGDGAQAEPHERRAVPGGQRGEGVVRDRAELVEVADEGQAPRARERSWRGGGGAPLERREQQPREVEDGDGGDEGEEGACEELILSVSMDIAGCMAALFLWSPCC